MPAFSFVNGCYRTPPEAASRWARKLPSLYFYPHLFWVIWRGSALAKRGRYGDDQWVASSLTVARALERAGVRFDITGVDHLQRLDGPCVIVGNHMSTLETAVLPSVINPIRRVTFVIKASLLEYPVFRHLMRTRSPIALEQKNPREDLKTVLTEGVERLERGISVVIFPEGARRKKFDAAEFNTLGVKLAHRAGVPLVPMALLTDAWALGRRFSDIGRIDPALTVHFAFGEPMMVEGRGVAEQQATIEFIERKLREWRSPAAAPADCAPVA
jgi:1-acyl-sn-glycerol-3-phosphate acyltransferase